MAAKRQGTIIYIEKENTTEAEFMSRSFINKEIRNRAYINALGAELVMKYLSSEGIDVSAAHNIHSISKILERIDIADILLPNIHIDVRVVFDENQIFIPKSHSKLEITPDIYVALKLDNKFKHVEFLGFFEPKQINKKNANAKYYFIEKHKLYPPEELKQYIKEFTGTTSRKLSQEDILRGRELSISLADLNISEDEEKELLELLLLSDELRESVLEFDNFETLSYNVAKEIGETSTEAPAFTLLPIDDSEQSESVNEEIDLSNTTLGEEDVVLDESFFDNEENQDEEETSEDESEEDSEEAEEPDDSEDDNEVSEETEEAEPEEDSAQISDEPELVPLNIDESIDFDDNLSIDNLALPDENIIEETTISTIQNPEEEFIEENIDLGDDLLDSDTTLEENEQEESSSAIEENMENSEAENHDQTKAVDSADEFTDFEDTENSEELTVAAEDVDLGDDLLEDDFNSEEELADNEAPLEEKDISEDIEETRITEKEVEINEEQTETEGKEEEAKPDNSSNSDISKGLAETITNALKKTAETTAAATIAGAAATAAAGTAATIGETAAAATASSEAIKLAGVAGEMVSDIVSKNLEKQQKNLDRIDYAKTTTNATEVPENLTALDLSVAKLEANIEAEISGQFDTPKDLSELNTIETVHEEEYFEPETIDLGEMKPIETEDFSEHTEGIVDFEKISNVDSPTKPVQNLEEKTSGPDDFAGMDLPDLSSYTINEDGSSNIDHFGADISFNNEQDEHLIEMKMNNEISFDNDDFDNSFDFENESVQEDAADMLLNDEVLDNTVSETQDTLITEDEISQESYSNDLDLTSDIETFDNIENDINIEEDMISESLPQTQEIGNSAVVDEMFTSEESDLTLDDSSIEDFDEFNGTLAENNDDENTENQNLQEKEIFTNETDNEIPEDVSIDNIDTEINQENTSLEQEIITADEIPSEITDIQTGEINSEIPADQTPEEAKEWLEDTNYDNLQDIEIEQAEPSAEEITPAPAVNDIPEEEFITEPDENQTKKYRVIENSTVISDRSFKVGEIPIDINNPDMPLPEIQDESLESLYNPNSKVPGAALLQSPGRLGRSQAKSGIGIGLGLIGGLVTLVIVCVIGFSVAKMFKAPVEEAPQPITDDTVPTSPDNGVSEANTLNVNPDNVVSMNNNSNSLATTQTPSAVKTQQTTAAQQPAASSSKKIMPATSFLEVRKLTWEVPDYISFNPQFKQYFQAVGKSLKLSLTSDLLLATDYAYSNEIKVTVTFDKDGTFKNSQILNSSGSAQIDNIVLQTVNQTLKALKAPHSVGNDESTTAILKIYF